MYKFYFEKLDVWKNSSLLTDHIYQLTVNFPKQEDYGITNQLRRAVVSVMANIAEGSCRTSTKEQIRFTNIAFSSLMEVVSFLIISKNRTYISDNKYYELREEISVIALQLNALKRAQEIKISREKS